MKEVAAVQVSVGVVVRAHLVNRVVSFTLETEIDGNVERVPLIRDDAAVLVNMRSSPSPWTHEDERQAEGMANNAGG